MKNLFILREWRKYFIVNKILLKVKNLFIIGVIIGEVFVFDYGFCLGMVKIMLIIFLI